ncbi:hypothetical protein V3C99_017076 [Haemonchus contortus]
MRSSLEDNQPAEQAGFRRNYSTIDHIHVIRQLIEKSTEYNIPLYFAFIDYFKAFDSVEHESLWKSLFCQGVHPKIIRLLSNIYKSAKVNIKICGYTKPIEIHRGVRQGDPISTALFAAALETVFRNIDWREEGININGEYLSHLRYAVDIVIIAHDSQKLQTMLEGVYEKSQAVGLKINFSKTTIMTNSVIRPVAIAGHNVQYCTDFVYLGQMVSFSMNNSVEIQRRIRAGWSALNRFRFFLTNRRVPMRFKRRVYEACVEPAILYACETWIMKKRDITMLKVAQRRMMRKMDADNSFTSSYKCLVRKCHKNQRYIGASDQKKVDMGEESSRERK